MHTARGSVALLPSGKVAVYDMRIGYVIYNLDLPHWKDGVADPVVLNHFPLSIKKRRPLWPFFYDGDIYLISNDEETGIHVWNSLSGQLVLDVKLDGERVTCISLLVGIAMLPCKPYTHLLQQDAHDHDHSKLRFIFCAQRGTQSHSVKIWAGKSIPYYILKQYMRD